MSGAVEGVALKRKVIARLCGQGHVTDWLTREGRDFQIVWRGKGQRVFFADRDDAYEALSLLRADAILELTTPPARSYADGVEPCADDPGCGCEVCWSKDSRAERDNLVEALGEFADGIDRFGFVNALGGHATTLRAAIRLLSQGGKV